MGFKSLFSRNKKSSTATATTTTPASTAPLVTRSPSFATRAQIVELEHVFTKFDVNIDDKISSSELSAIMGSLGHPETDDELYSMILKVDGDGDDFIDIHKFVKLKL